MLEKRYAIFPQRSGELTIQREIFNGSRGRGGIFSRKQAVSAVSESHTINVKTIPAGFKGENWIPAKALAVNQSWGDAAPTFRVGEPVNRTITLSAIGLSGTVLPAIEDLNIDKAKVYADPPEIENRITDEGINALQVTTIGIVPTEEGALYLPEIRVPWWNTQTDQQEIAIIPGATFTVLPSVDEMANVPKVTIPVTELNQPTVVQEVSSPYWQWAAIILGLLWLVSTSQWVSLRKQVRILESASARQYDSAIFEDPDEQREYKALKTACTRNRASETHRQLFLWMKAREPGLHSIHQLGRQHQDFIPLIQNLRHTFSATMMIQPGVGQAFSLPLTH